MGRKSVPESIKWQVIGQFKTGKNKSEISRLLNISRKCVINTIRVYKKSNNVKNKSRSGRPRVTNSRVERLIVNKVKNNRSITANSLKNELKEELSVNISRQTINRRLLEKNLKSCVATRKPLLTEKNRKARFEWCKDKLSWKPEKWMLVLFSDESSFQLFSNRPKRVRRTASQKYDPACLAPKVQKGGGSVMVWGCLSGKGTGELQFVDGTINSDKYIQTMENYMLPSKRKVFGRRKVWLYQQDNAPCHTSKKSMKWIKDNGVPLLDWPARSPDLNIIENAWDQIERMIKDKNCKNLQDLKREIAVAWQNLTGSYCKKLAESMVRRVQACYEAKGGATKY